MSSKQPQKTFLLSLDGWGLSTETKGNAIHHANTPFMDSCMHMEGKFAKLNASGLFVGLPDKVMGNSEVGHLTMGAGRELYTDLVKINMAIKKDTLKNNPTLCKAFDTAKKGKKNLHMLGLLSDGGVHSHIDHLKYLILCAKEFQVSNCFVHAFMDGRDTPPNSGPKYIEEIMEFMRKNGYGKLSSVVGRYFAMDRDKRWERIARACDLLVNGKGRSVEYSSSAIIQILEQNYKANNFDETMEPINPLQGTEGKIAEGDVLLFIDFRSDRMRQIVETFGLCPPFKANFSFDKLHVFTMTEYNASFGLPVLFPPEYCRNSLSECVSRKGYKQFHIAETEKYAHVTFFFNGRSETPFPGEDRELIQSPSVKTYDLQPEMSMFQVKNKVLELMTRGSHEFIMCNFAPPDMVGHTGNYSATVKACEFTDQCIKECAEVAYKNDYVMIVTSDHGNAEEMLDSKGNPKTSHNCNLVPFVILSPKGADREYKIAFNPTSSLKDVAPTVCEVMGIDIPEEMTGQSLLC